MRAIFVTFSMWIAYSRHNRIVDPVYRRRDSMVLRIFKQVLILMALAIFAPAAFMQTSHAQSYIDTSLENGISLKTVAGSANQQAPGEIMVRYRDSVSTRSKLLIRTTLGMEIAKEFNHVGSIQLLTLPKGMSVHKAIRNLSEQPEVLYAEPNYVVVAHAIPNDAQFPSQWGLNNTKQGDYYTEDADIDAPEAWDLTTGNRNTVIAVIDSGVDYTHPDLSANMFQNSTECTNNGEDDDGNGYIDDCYGINVVAGNSDPMDDQYHGTHIAGIIGAVGNNSVGVAGVNWETRILSCKFLDADGYGTIAGAIACLDYIAGMKDRGVNIVASNNSWGGIDYSKALRDAIDAQLQRGILFVTSAGDEGFNNDDILMHPCAYNLPNVICVNETSGFDYVSGNGGARVVHISAPGVTILSTVPVDLGGYASLTGTSMAAAFTTGVAGLIHARFPGSDWRNVRNRILAGGDPVEHTEYTITGRRLNAYGALTCNNSIVLARLRPLGFPIDPILDMSVTVGAGSPIELSALHINCAVPNGSVPVAISTGETVTLLDNGMGKDLVAGDGIYTASWMPPAAGTFTLSFPNNDDIALVVDPDLQPGFPVKAWASSGDWAAKFGPNTLIANIDGGPGFQIFATSIALGPLNAWDSTGQRLPGWPLDTAVAFASAGEFSSADPGDEIFVSAFFDRLEAVDGSGKSLPGWPKTSAYFLSAPASLSDIDSDGIDEVFIEEGDAQIHGYRADGTALDGWPPEYQPVADTLSPPAIADLDGDGDLEIITATNYYYYSAPEKYLVAYHHSGTLVEGFPATFDGYGGTHTSIGDVDGDGKPDIVLVSQIGFGSSSPSRVLIFGNNGIFKRSIPLTGNYFSGTGPALADLDSDGSLEIIVQTDAALNVVRGDGTDYPGWPVYLEAGYENGGSLPLVGDVDGDGLPDIVVTTQFAASSLWGVARVFNRDGISHPHFPKRLPIGRGEVSAIADIDADGHNEIIITGNSFGGQYGYFDKVWVYDLGGPTHGPVLWGQFMGNGRHTGTATTVYPSAPVYRTLTLEAGSNGIVTSNPMGINCGSDCSAFFVEGTSIVLTATGVDGYHFSAWEGDCSGQQGNTCTLNMSSNKMVSARFAPIQYRLTIRIAGSGSGKVTSGTDNINCGGICTYDYNSGTTISLTATGSNGSTFSGWSSGCLISGSHCSITMNADISVTATFTSSSNSGTNTSSGGGGCFIATAAYGSYMADDVIFLRGFRDRNLLTNTPGRAFVKWYYRISPPLADSISRHRALRVTTRMVLFPIVSSMKHPWLMLLCLAGLAVLVIGRKTSGRLVK